MITKRKMLVLTIAFLLLAQVNGVSGQRPCHCDLPYGSLNQQIERARTNAVAIFSGEVVSIADAPDDLNFQVTFKIDRVWKGTLHRNLIVDTRRAGCGFPFKLHETYLVYARETDSNRIETSICERTIKYSKGVSDLKVLGVGTTRTNRTKSNKSLDRSAGSVFRIKFGAAKVA